MRHQNNIPYIYNVNETNLYEFVKDILCYDLSIQVMTERWLHPKLELLTGLMVLSIVNYHFLISIEVYKQVLPYLDKRIITLMVDDEFTIYNTEIHWITTTHESRVLMMLQHGMVNLNNIFECKLLDYAVIKKPSLQQQLYSQVRADCQRITKILNQFQQQPMDTKRNHYMYNINHAEFENLFKMIRNEVFNFELIKCIVLPPFDETYRDCALIRLYNTKRCHYEYHILNPFEYETFNLFNPEFFVGNNLFRFNEVVQLVTKDYYEILYYGCTNIEIESRFSGELWDSLHEDNLKHLTPFEIGSYIKNQSHSEQCKQQLLSTVYQYIDNDKKLSRIVQVMYK